MTTAFDGDWVISYISPFNFTHDSTPSTNYNADSILAMHSVTESDRMSCDVRTGCNREMFAWWW
jgi:hypothetical protein